MDIDMRMSGPNFSANASYRADAVSLAKDRRVPALAMQLVATTPNVPSASIAAYRHAVSANDSDRRFDANLMNLFMLLKAVDPTSDPTAAAEGGNEIRRAYDGLPPRTAPSGVLPSRRAWPYRP